MTETQVFFGGQVKALGNGKVGGYLIRYGDATKTDLEGEYFTPETHFGRAKETDVYYQHGLDKQLKNRVLGGGNLKKDEVGVWIEAQLELRDEYEKAIYGMVEAGKMGWSSGSASHLVDRIQDGKSSRITHWVIAEASITPTPAEPRNSALPLKSLINSTAEAELSEASETSEDAIASTEAATETNVDVDKEAPIVKTTVEVIPMTENQVPDEGTQQPPTPVDNGQEEIKALSAQVEKLTQIMMDNAPRYNRAGAVISETGGTSDPHVKSFGDWLTAVKLGDTSRLRAVYGSTKAQTEGSGAAGGFLVPEQFLPLLNRQLNLNSNIPNLVTTINVQSPSGKVPTLDYSVAPTAGSGETAEAAGVSTQSRAEGGAYAEETANFEMIQYTVNDSVSGYVRVSKELMEDYGAIESILTQRIAIAKGSKVERDILRGSGVNEPLGVTNWAGIVNVNEDTDNTFAYEDALEMYTHLARFGGTPVWVVHPSIWTEIGQFEVGTGGAVLVNELDRSIPMSLLSFPVITSQHLPLIGSDYYALLCDFSAYYLFVRGGMYIDYSPHADFMNGNDTWRFGQRMDGKPAMTSSVELANPGTGYLLSPFVGINNLS